jgi:plastocyanin
MCQWLWTRGTLCAGTTSSSSTPIVAVSASTTCGNGEGSAGGQCPSSTVAIPSGAGVGPSAAPGYLPDTITVVIGVNDTVTWRNDDTVSHTVYSMSVPAGAATFSSPLIAPQGTYSQTFKVAGTYQTTATFTVG